MPVPGQIRTAAELLDIVNRRMDDANEVLKRATDNGESLDVNYARGQLHELMTVHDLLAIILDHPRTYYVATK